jgi:hypothetical protein
MSQRELLRIATAAGLALCLQTAAMAAGPGIETSGPDVTVSVLTDVFNGGVTDGIWGYNVGTTSCNIGETPVNWCDNAGGCSHLTWAQHPVIAQALYRLENGRFEQLSSSWLKHGFVSTNSGGACKIGEGCSQPPLGGNQLGVGCTDTYGGGLNGSRPLGLKSEVNATNGVFPFPETFVPFSANYDQRIKVAQTELDPAIHTTALFWVDAQYVSDNDAQFGNGLNNASYRGVTVTAGTYNLPFSGSLVRERSGIHAWKAADAAVQIHNVDVPGAIVERYELARKVTPVDGDTWHYEYVIRNMNSDRSARVFSIDFPDNTPIANAGFNDSEHHSGEPYSTADWDVSVTQATGTISWGTSTFGNDPNANALRWGIMFNFWFDADVAPDAEIHTIGLFKPGSPTNVSFRMPIFADGFEANNLVAWEIGTAAPPPVPDL